MIKDKLRPYYRLFKAFARHVLEALRVLKFTFHYKYYRLLRTPPIKVINLNAIDICNSKCQMCNIWKQKEDKKISPEEFSKILDDKLFQTVEHVGVTGGEPTLRKDLMDVYKALVETLPRLKGVSIISNAIRSDDVVAKIKIINEYCQSKNVSFGAMVSLDGVGSVHDKIRGIPGNFIHTEKVINALKKEHISLSTGATISKDNVWEIEELLYYLRKNNIYGRFRVAEFIKRLYNEDSQVIRTFTEDETYQLAIFFHKLELSFEKHKLYKRTYRNIRMMLLGEKRQIGCPYHSEGIVLNSEGEISYCAPKSPLIGNALQTSAADLYKVALSTRNAVFGNNCDDCIHDYHYPELIGEHLRSKFETFQKELFSIKFRKLSEAYIKFLGLTRKKQVNPGSRRVLILGWYGTETVGDKAILGGIIESFLALFPDVKFTIASIVPYITIRTMKELGYEAEVISSKSFELFRKIPAVDEVVMGGGPLMDLDDLMIPYNGFLFASLLKIKTTVFGCGIGPLHFPHFESLVKKILLMADEVRLRDVKSQDYAIKLFKEHKKNLVVSCTGDPAKHYLRKVVLPRTDIVRKSKNELCLYLREWTHEYARNLSREEFLIARERFESGLSKVIVDLARQHGVETIRFCHMHNFVIGHDDRDFSIRFIDTYLKDIKEFKVTYDKGLSTVDSICESMLNAKFNLCMRFHSVVFADTLDTDYLAIDYTLGGKIFNYLKDNLKLQNLIEVENVKCS